MVYQQASSFLRDLPDIPVVDVRSPSEYGQGHIPGATNIPLFSDAERASVGTIYKKSGKSEAIGLGLEIVGPKMKALTDQAKKLAGRNKLKVYCWRGGMRSEKMAWLFELVGIHCMVLEKGYKSYRNRMLEEFKDLDKLVVLQGPTGSGKTDILKAMRRAGEQVIDLEGLANHKGSAFGHIGMKEQPTSQQFQNDIFHHLVNFNKTRRIWIESESLTIGKVYLPETLWESMNQARIIQIDLGKKFRIERLVKDYGAFDTRELAMAAEKIQRKFGGDKVEEVKTCLDNGQLDKAAELLLDYYDRSYLHSQKVYKKITPEVVHLESNDAILNASLLIDRANRLEL